MAATHLIIDINGYFLDGVVSSLSAGAGLAGGGTGAVTLGVAPGGVTNGMLAGGVTDDKLAPISAAGKVANSATTATAANVPNAIVARDHSGGFAAGAVTLSGRIDQTSDEGLIARGTISSGTIPASGPGVRLMWYPAKAALRAGSVNTNLIFDELFGGPQPSPGTQWDDPNVGSHSFAFGENVRAVGDYAAAFGKESHANGLSTFAAGEVATATGAASVALGYHAHTNARQGSFVFGDRSTIDVVRAGVNHSATWRVTGGFRIFTAPNLSTGVTIQSGSAVSNWGQANAVISTSTGAYLTTSGVWTNNSSRAAKTDFADVDARSVLQKVIELPISTWRYNAEPSGVRHMGPVAQDFSDAFSLGRDETTIGTVDADGVALAAIQGLHQELKVRDEEVAALQDELARQRAAIDQLKALVCVQAATAELCK